MLLSGSYKQNTIMYVPMYFLSPAFESGNHMKKVLQNMVEGSYLCPIYLFITFRSDSVSFEVTLS